MQKRSRKLLCLLLVLALATALLPGLPPAAAAAEDGTFTLLAADCTVIGAYMDENAYLRSEPLPEGAKTVVFGDFEPEGCIITSMTATDVMLEDVNEAPLSELFAYTADDAAGDDSWALTDDYADFAFEGCLAYFVMDAEGGWAVFVIRTGGSPEPSEYDRSFTVTAGGAVIPETDIVLAENGYRYKDMAGRDYVGTVDAYVVTVPAGTEKVLLTFAENRLAYNYTAAGDYLGGYYEDWQAGALTAEVPLDYGTESAPADGEIDYIQVQTPYDDALNSVLLYAVTFRLAGGEEPGPEAPEEPGGPLTPAQVRDAIAARYAAAGCAADANAPWLTADMMAYLAAFPDTEYRLSEAQLQELTDKFIDALSKASSASEGV